MTSPRATPAASTIPAASRTLTVSSVTGLTGRGGRNSIFVNIRRILHP